MLQNELSSFSEEELLEFQKQVALEIEERNAKIKEFFEGAKLSQCQGRDDGEFNITIVANKEVLKKLKRIL